MFLINMPILIDVRFCHFDIDRIYGYPLDIRIGVSHVILSQCKFVQIYIMSLLRHSRAKTIGRCLLYSCLVKDPHHEGRDEPARQPQHELAPVSRTPA